MSEYINNTQVASGGSYTVETDTDLLLWIAYGYRGGTTTASNQTFGGIAMTEEHDNTTDIAGLGDPVVSAAYKVGPALTSQALSVDWSAALTAESGFAISLKGVDQINPVYLTNGSSAATYGATNTPSLTYDAPADSTVIYYKFHATNSASTIAAPAGFNLVVNSVLLTTPAYRQISIYERKVTVAETAQSVGADTSGSAAIGGVHGVIVFQAVEILPGIQIGTVDSDDVVYIGQTGITAVGTGYEATQGSGTVKISPTDNINDPNSIFVTATAWSETGVTFDIPAAFSMLYGTVYLFITNNSAEVNANGKVLSLVPPAANDYLIIREQSDFGVLKDVVGLELGADQLEYAKLSGAGGTVYMGISGTFRIYNYAGAVPSTDTISVRLGDASDQTWSSDAVSAINLGNIQALTGTSTNTMSAFSQNAAGDVVNVNNLTGTSDNNISAFTQDIVANAVNVNHWTGTSGNSLGAFTQNIAADRVGIWTGTSSSNMGSFSQSSSGVVGHVGTAANSLSAFSQDSAGTLGHTGAATSSLSAFSQDSSGTLGHVGTATNSLSAFSQSAAGDVVNVNNLTGTSSNTLGSFTQSASGTLAGAPTVSSVTDPLLDASTGNSLVTSGFNADITGVKIKTGALELTVSNLAGTGNNYTFDVPDVSSFGSTTAGIPFTSAGNTHTVEATDGTDTESISVDYSPKAGWAVVDVLNATNAQGSVSENFTKVPGDGSQYYYPTANNTSIDATGILTTDTTESFDMLFWDVSSNEWKPFSVIAISSITGTSNSNLGSFIQSSSVILGKTGSASQTLSAFSQNANGVYGHLGTSSQTLEGFSQNAIGGKTKTGTASNVMSAFVQNATGTVEGVANLTGTVSQTLSAFNQNANGLVTSVGSIIGSADSAIGAFTQDIAATAVNVNHWTGTSSSSLGAFSQDSSGTVGHVGSAGSVMSVFTQESSGVVTTVGSVSNNLGSFSQEATGTVVNVNHLTGTVSSTLVGFSQSSSGDVVNVNHLTGTQVTILKGFTQDANGFATNVGNLVGIGRSSLQSFSQDLEANTVNVNHWTGTASSTLGSFGQSSTGTVVNVNHLTGDSSQVLNSFSTNIEAQRREVFHRTGTADSILQGFSEDIVGVVTQSYFAEVNSTLGSFTQDARTIKGADGTVSSNLSGFSQTFNGVVRLEHEKYGEVSSVFSGFTTEAIGKVYNEDLLPDLSGYRIKQIYATSSKWAYHNPILKRGEMGIESDTQKMKVGTGKNRWVDTNYVVGRTLDTGDIDQGSSNFFITQAGKDVLASTNTDFKWEFDITDEAGGYTGYITSDGDWMIKNRSGQAKTYATESNNGAYDNLDDAWENRGALTYE